MSSGCAPHHAPSTVLRLESPESFESISFNLGPSGGVSVPGAIRFGPGRPNGLGAPCSDPETCQPADWGEITFLGSTEDGAIVGGFTLVWDGGRRVRGSFDAEWLAIQALCR